MSDNLIELTLPTSWIFPLAYDDFSGMDAEEIEAFQQFMDAELADFQYTGCRDNTEGFVKYHDARVYYPYACDCSMIMFQQI